MARIILFLALMILTAPVAAENARIPDGLDAAQQTAVSPPAPAEHAPQIQGQPADGFWAFWNHYDGPIRTAFLMIAGAAGFGFAFWRARIAARQASTAERGHAIDRFSIAVEHLVSEHLPVRLGGIDALWRIGRESPKEQKETVLGILCAFLREPPHWSAKDNRRSIDSNPETRADVQTILDLIRYDMAWYRHDLPHYILDINGADLAGAILKNANLASANHEGVNLKRAHLFNANLTDADLMGANLTGAFLTDAILAGADLTGATLTHANFTGANLSGAHFSGADFGAEIEVRIDRRGASFESPRHRSANLTGTNLTRADLVGAKNLSQRQLDSACVAKGGNPPMLDEGLNPPSNICSED